MIVSVAFSHFLPFRAPVVLNLADRGLVLVRGRNEVSAAADANGVGKTSVLHAIAWALFGEDLRGRRGDDVACRFTRDQCRVQVYLEDALGKWSVLRTRRPTGLAVEGVDGIGENEDMKVTQGRIEQRLGFGIRTFKNAVVFGQGTFDRFAAADQSEKMRMLDEIQGVDFRAALDRAKEWRSALEVQDAKACRDAATSDTLAQMKRDEAASLLALKASFESSRQAAIDAAVHRIDVVDQELAAARAELVAVDALRKFLPRVRAKATANAALGDQMRAAENDAGEVLHKRDAAENDLAEFDYRLKNLVDNGTCPTCMQPTKVRRAAIAKLFKPERERHADRLLRADAVFAGARDAAEKGRRAWERENLALGEMLLTYLPSPTSVSEPPLITRISGFIARLEERGSDGARDRLRATEGRSEIALATLEAEARRLRGGAWDGQVDLDAAQLDVAEAVLAAAVSRARAGRITAARMIADYWVEAFGDRGLRNLLAESVRDFLNERLERHLGLLASGELLVRMATQKTLKGGAQRDAVTFESSWAWGGDGPEDGSGGQDRRKDLAVFAAVQDLAEARSARPFPFKAWDEPGDALDARGKEMFLQWVSTEARRRGTGLLITHSEEIASMVDADATWTIVLDADGARVEEG